MHVMSRVLHMMGVLRGFLAITSDLYSTRRSVGKGLLLWLLSSRRHLNYCRLKNS
jgi:hypothetical protein